LRTWRAASGRHLLRHPVQLGLALLGLTLGVATITSIWLATASARRALELSLDAISGAATHQLIAGPQGVPETLYVELLSDGPDAELAPLVEGYVIVDGRSFRLLGIDPLVDWNFRSFAAIERLGGIPLLRRWLTAPGAVSMSRSAAAVLQLEIGKPLKLQVSGREYDAVLTAIIADERPGLDTVVLTDIAQAQEWLGSVGRLSRIDVRLAGDQPGERQLAKWRARLPPGVSVGETERRSHDLAELSSAFMTNLKAMSLLALLVGSFLIYNSMSFALIQRRPTLGILRALGVTRGEVLATVLAEVAILGAVGAALGALAGIWLAGRMLSAVTRTINDLYFVASVSAISLEPATLIVAAVTGLGAALLAALVPSLEAARTLPQLALRRSTLEQRAARAAAVLLAVSAALLAAAGLSIGLSNSSLVAGFAALLMLMLAAAALTPATLRACATLAARAVRRRSIAVQLALGDVAASTSRTGVAVAALAIAVAAAIGVALMVASFRHSVSAWLERTLRADIYVMAPGPGFSRPERVIDAGVALTLIGSELVVDHSATRRVAVESPFGPVLLDALEPAARSLAGVALIEGSSDEAWPAFARGDVLVSEPLAYRRQLRVGDSLELVTASGPRRFRVAGIYRDYGSDRGAVLMSRAHYRSAWGDDAITSLGLYLAAGSDTSAAIAALSASTRDRQALLMRSNSELRNLSMQIFERTFAITRILYWLALTVAGIGLLSALLAYELERARELAVLRALGMTPLGIAGLVETQTLFLGLVAAAIAVPTGLVAAVVLIEVINRRAFGWRIDLFWSGPQVAATLAVALAAALLAGLYPAWRSSRALVADDLREE
jgi:putative ABC transport system permease protein